MSDGGAADAWAARVERPLEALDAAADPSPALFGDLFAAEARRAVPWLTRDALTSGRLRSGMLVRYRGMVQDMFDPEYFDAKVRCERPGPTAGSDPVTETRSALYRDHFAPGDGVKVLQPTSPIDLRERLPLYCVPVPGETAWARQRRLASGPDSTAGQAAADDASSTMSGGHRKRLRADLDLPPLGTDSTADSQTSTEPMGGSDDLEGPSAVKKPSGRPSDEQPAPASDKSAPAEPASGLASSMQELRLAQPFQPQGEAERDLACIVKVYDFATAGFRLNELVEFVGVLAVSPDYAHSVTGADAEAFDAREQSARKPPSSLVPRLHCLQFLRQPPTFVSSAALDDLAATRDAALQLLKEHVFAGDQLPAEYMLMWLVSGAFARPCEQVVVGKLSLALTRLERQVVRRLSELLAQFLPRCQTYHLNVDELNAASIAPRKCNEANRLRAGRLQMCPGTPILVDETTLDAGELKEQGVRNLHTLSRLASEQVISYDFQFYQLDWQVDLPVLITTGNRKPLVDGSDVCVPAVRPEGPEPPLPPLSSQAVEALRVFVETVRGTVDPAKFEIPDALCEQIEADFVRERQKDKSLDQQHLHSRLNLARLWARSHGRGALDQAGWSQVLSLEAERCKRAEQAAS